MKVAAGGRRTGHAGRLERRRRSCCSGVWVLGWGWCWGWTIKSLQKILMKRFGSTTALRIKVEMCRVKSQVFRRGANSCNLRCRPTKHLLRLECHRKAEGR